MDMSVPDAVRLAAAGDPGTGGQFLTFAAAGDTYALPIAAIKEIIEHGQITEIPLMPPCILGVINLRGAVVPVVDLAARLGFAPSRPGRRTCVVVVETLADEDRVDMGLVVDGVSEVVELDATQLGAAPSFGAKVRNDFIQAMASVRGRFVVVMQPAQLLSIQELAQLSRGSVDAADAGAWS